MTGAPLPPESAGHQPPTGHPMPPHVPPNPVAVEQMQLQVKVKRGLGWFYWIGALSVVNLVIFLAGSNSFFVVGLGTAMIAHGFAESIGVPVLGAVIAAGLAGLFGLFGYLSIRGNRAAACIGTVLYLGDAAIFVLLEDWLSVGFHALALVGLISGTAALLRLHGTGAFLPPMPAAAPNGAPPPVKPIAEPADDPSNPYAS